MSAINNAGHIFGRRGGCGFRDSKEKMIDCNAIFPSLGGWKFIMVR